MWTGFSAIYSTFKEIPAAPSEPQDPGIIERRTTVVRPDEPKSGSDRGIQGRYVPLPSVPGV